MKDPSIGWPGRNDLEKNEKGENRKYDTDCVEDMEWITNKAIEIKKEKKIVGNVDYFMAMGVIKNIIPAIASTNALIASSCVVEGYKILYEDQHTLFNEMLYLG